MTGPAAGEEPPGPGGHAHGAAGETGRPAIPGARSDSRSHHLPRLLAALSDRLPEDRAVAWEHFVATVTGPEDPLLDGFAAGQSAAGLSGQLKAITQAWRAEAPGLPGTGLALAFATVRALPRPPAAQTVVSGPLSTAIPVRLTNGVALEVIRSAESSLLIASFAAHGARDVVAEIAEAIGRRVQVDLLLEESTQAAAAFAALPAEVRLWHRSKSRGVLHAKLIAADRGTAFLGSANLTDRALTDNIELGVVLRDPEVVGPLVDHFQWLISPENHFMRRASLLG